MRYPPLIPSLTPARVVFEASAATVEVESRPDRQTLFSRYAGYYVLLSRLSRRLRRQLQRRWRRSLAGIALLLALGQVPALAAILRVAPGVAPEIAPDGACSLIEAIDNANADTPTHADCPSTGGAFGSDLILLPASSTQALTQVHNTEFSSNGLPVIRSDITIEGSGSTIRRAGGAPEFRIFCVDSTGNLALRNTTVSGGAATFEIGPTVPARNGGGILLWVNGRLTITNSTVSGNRAGRLGGGVLNNKGTLTLTNSIVSGNSSAFYGGGVHTERGTVTVTNTTISGNTAGTQGGGIFTGSAGTLTLTNSTISGNTAGTQGGGIRAITGTLTLTTSTVSGNTAGTDGGGLFSNSIVILTRSLVSGNSANDSGAEVFKYLDSVYSVTTSNFSLFGHSGFIDAQAFSGFTPGATDLTATSDGNVPTALPGILDTTLAHNGGPTTTHALVVGSPAIDAAGTGCPPPATDQRGAGRPEGPECDIGAFEITTSSTANLAVSLTDTPDPLTVNGQLLYTITVRNNGPGTATGVQVTDILPEAMALAGPVGSSQGECGGTGKVTCNLGTLAAGARVTVTINVIPTAAGVFSNTATVVGNEADLFPANNSATETTTVREPIPENADLAITAAATPEPGASGQGLTYTLTVTNNGPQTATGVQLTDDLPGGVVLDGPAIPSQGVCRGTDPATCNLGTLLPSGAEAVVTIDVIPTTAGTLTSRATVNLNETDPDFANNAASTTTTVRPPVEPLTSQATCSTVRCVLRLVCNQAESLDNNCENEVTLFVRAPAGRLSGELAARAVKRIRFAAAVTNIPPGRIERVRLTLTNRGKRTAKDLIQQGKRKLRGILQIRNAPGGTDAIPLTLRLR